MAQARQHRIDELSEGSKASVTFTVTAQQMRQFAEISGDFNPLHTDESFARAKGYEGPVVYGALLVAKVSQLIGMELPGRDSVWASIALDFRRPLFVGQEAEAEGTVTSVHRATGMVELALALRANGKVLAKGKAEVVLGA
ncbi:MAG TPA: MaoC/PaaZ C-terminal domain-containing protein [Polyangiaceae bacterium]|nr:MaoC/PaaZ C-terminal domain-containing protein [Polyangiaceae bacterium]